MDLYLSSCPLVRNSVKADEELKKDKISKRFELEKLERRRDVLVKKQEKEREVLSGLENPYRIPPADKEALKYQHEKVNEITNQRKGVEMEIEELKDSIEEDC